MPTSRIRPDPQIPDHEVLRLIGGGAYGEVWLARGVTGALRAVKVLWREDFEDERSFEREFEGILKYEPISRDHPGLMNILHVGRSQGETDFYYYVMELGDDVHTGSDINPVEYEPRTLRSDTLAAGGKLLETDFVIEVGERLAEALKYLHDYGLAHRDIKPANVIFVNGRAKLADIGLVAARGQRTFVGTEGFVPPEGPGSAQADVYSLCKVLYEMATGKDRLDFPELPDEIPDMPERTTWLALNQLICDACEPQISKRGVTTAGDLADSLARLSVGKTPRRKSSNSLTGAIMALFIGAGCMALGWEFFHRTDLPTKWGWVPPVAPTPTAPQSAFIKVTSTPEGADVIDIVDEESGEVRLIGRTPTDVLDAFVGEKLILRILKDGYQPYEIKAEVPGSATEEPYVISANLKIYAPPVVDEPWSDQFGQDYRPLGDGHESVLHIGQVVWKDYTEDNKQRKIESQNIEVKEGTTKRQAIATSEAESQKFCDWLVKRGIDEGYLTEGYEAIPIKSDDFDESKLQGKAANQKWKPFRVLVRPIPYGRLLVETDPPGAEVFLNEVSQGSAYETLLIDKIKPGTVTLMATHEGFKSESRNVRIKPKQMEKIVFELQENRSAIPGQPWENSLGMRFVPIDEDWMVSIWETRRSDFEQFAKAERIPMPELADWPIGVDPKDLNDHPVVSVSREDCEAFCKWLTKKERKQDWLTPQLEYRLPTDLEWSVLCGLNDVSSYSPAKRDRLKPGENFWIGEWPPPSDIENFGVITGFTDEYTSTSPVGAFRANDLGLYDLAGNAQEWVSDDYSAFSTENGLLRGGSWKSSRESELYKGSRNPQPPTATDVTYGFRVVLAKKPADDPEVSESDAES